MCSRSGSRPGGTAAVGCRTLADLRDLSSSTARGRDVAAVRADFERLRALPLHRAPASSSAAPFSESKVVLVTGASGHVGYHFCELLETRGVRVVRAARSLGYDLSLPNFGLSDVAYGQLALECDAVVHCAAIVNWSLGYEALRSSNVEGTWNVIEFCFRGTGGEKPLLFVGSGAGWPERVACMDWLEECDSPYMMSKLTSEALVQVRCDRAVVVRPGLVVWHSTSGAHKAADALPRVVDAACIANSIWMPEDGDNLLEGMNVDSFCVAALALFERGGPEVYSLQGAFPLSALADALDESSGRGPLRREAYADWHSAASKLCQSDPSHPLAPLLPHLDSTCAPFGSPAAQEALLSERCQVALGEEHSRRVVRTVGSEAFVAAVRKRCA
mmetsp:Transcript_144388/g.462598  ORF Transcript_144388/g.462598 Transcript_144388/m.462598 type:complete len:388 (+) Transcript_144388:1202-2365(+)